MKVKLISLLIFFALLSQISLEIQFMESPGVRKLSEFAIDPVKLFNKSLTIKDEGKKEFNNSITQKDIIDKMGFGWNLGNTLDAFNLDNFSAYDKYSEGRWGQPKTTEAIIQIYKNKGLKSFRVPVTWHNHLIDENYSIDPQWMTRVKEIVDWGLKNDFIVILNSHHDGAKVTDQPLKYRFGYYTANSDRAESERFIYNIWSQIAITFNNGYDQNLLFECMNEPRPEKTSCEWSYKKGDPICEEATSSINEYNKICLKAIRESGGNNEKRFVLVTGLGAQYHSTVGSDFIFPGDDKYNPTNNKIMLSVHMYFPYDFAYNSDKKYSEFTDRIKNDFYAILRNLYDKYVLRGHNVVVGEMGCNDKNNTAERVKWANFYIQTTRKFQMSCLVWEVSPFAIYVRKESKWKDEALVKALIDSSKTELSDNPEEEYEQNLISSPVTFSNWNVKIYLDYIMFSGYNSFCKLVFTKIDTNPVTKSPALKISYADWTSAVAFSQSDVEGAVAGSGGGMGIVKGTQNIKIFLNNSMCKIIQSKGLVFDGNGFIINDVHISGPRFVKMEPKIIIRSSKKQILQLYFNENANAISNNIIFTNFYYNLNNQIKCLVDQNNNKIINCEGIYNFTGEFFLKDINDYPLTNKFLNVVPNKGEKYNINNLIETKINFDYSNQDKQIFLSKNLFSDLTKNSKLIIETMDLHFNTSYQNFKIYNNKNNKVINIKSDDVNTTVEKDGALKVPPGRNLIVIDLNDYYKTLKDDGITIKGYGFAVNSIYIKKGEDKRGISGWGIFLIILVCLLVITGGVFIFLHWRKKNIEKEINSLYYNEKMLN